MQNYLNALAGGVLIGAASWWILAALGRVAGISGIANSAIFGADKLHAANYWRWAFLAGLVLGGAAFTLWFAPASVLPRSPIVVALAGLLVGFGTVLGAGCTSGHGVCGLGRRSARSFVAVCVFMCTGFATVWLAGKFGFNLI